MGEKVSLMENEDFRLNLQLFAEEVDDDGDGGEGESSEKGGAGDSKKKEEVYDKKFDASYVKTLREEAARYRKERKEFSEKANKLDKQLKQIQKALGLKDDDEPDLEQLSADLKNKDQALRSLKLEVEVGRVAEKLGMDKELSHALLLKKGALDELDLESKKLSVDLEQRMKELLEEIPKLKSDSTTVKKAGDDQGGGDKGGKSGQTMNDLIRKAMGREL